jgi:hypothetical protein
MVFVHILPIKQKKSHQGWDFGGYGRIRTAVQGFADLCLATRPRNLFCRGQIYEKSIAFTAKSLRIF